MDIFGILNPDLFRLMFNFVLESCLKGSFLCPIVMNKIYLETERHGNIEVS